MAPQLGPTIAQGAFALFLLACVPGYAVCGGWSCTPTARGWWGGLWRGAAGGLLGLLVASLVAILRHPDYPRLGPPEHTALLYLVPAFAIAIANCLALARYGAAHAVPNVAPERLATFQRRARRLLVGGTLLAGVLIVGRYQLFVWPPHRALPWSATEVHEEAETEWLLPDYGYELSARITPAAFEDYLRDVGLDERDRVEGPGRRYLEESGQERFAVSYADGRLHVSSGAW